MSVSSSDKHTCKLKLFRNRIENANRKGKTDLHSTLVADRAAYKKYYAEKQFARIFSVDNTDSIFTYSNKLKIIRNRIEKAKSNGQEDLHTKLIADRVAYKKSYAEKQAIGKSETTSSADDSSTTTTDDIECITCRQYHQGLRMSIKSIPVASITRKMLETMVSQHMVQCPEYVPPAAMMDN